MANDQGRDETLQEKIGQQVRRYDSREGADPERPHYEVYACALRAILEKACVLCGVLGFVEVRAKATASFAEKISRKGQELEDPVTQFTDLCGARVITQTQEEVLRICQFIRRHFKIDEANSPDIRSRLQVGEFGYLSEHLVVQMPWATLNGISLRLGGKVRPEESLLRDILDPLDPKGWTAVAQAIGARKAEIQVRTLLQHAWAAISHDRVYKSEFEPPQQLKRRLHRMAALLEEADGQLQGAIDQVDTYNLNYAAYLEPKQIEREMARWNAVLPYATGAGAVNVALKIARLAVAQEDWPAVISALGPHAESGRAAVLRELGLARSKLGEGGREELEAAISMSPKDVDALCYLGDTYCCRSDAYLGSDPQGGDCREACRHYSEAFEAAPAEPHALGSYLECSLCLEKNIGALPLLRPGLEAAMRTCQERADIGIYLPYAYYDMGRFLLMLDRPYESLSAFAKAVHHSRSPRKIEAALSAIDRLRDAARHALGKLPEEAPAGERAHLRQWLCWCEWLRRFLLLARAVKLQQVARDPGGSPEEQRTADAAVAELRDELATAGRVRADKPVVIVAGGTDQSVQQQMAEYAGLVMLAFAGFEGTIISGGTTAGISGVIGGLTVAGGVEKVSYLPDQRHLPDDAELHDSYDIREPLPLEAALRPPLDEGPVPFSALEPIQCWIDLVCGGVAPGEVTVLGINGGRIAAFEYRLALALGATVGIIQSSGRAAAEMLEEAEHWRRGSLVWLPADTMSLRAFVQPPGKPQEPFGDPQVLDRTARVVHEKYREDKIASSDPALRPWDALDQGYKNSNRQQVLCAGRILAACGYELRPKRARGAAVRQFGKGELEKMADMEHGRFVAERLREGWQLGPVRDKARKLSPYLCGWAELPDGIKEYDRKAVRDWPGIMATAGLKIVRRPAKGRD